VYPTAVEKTSDKAKAKIVGVKTCFISYNKFASFESNKMYFNSSVSIS